MMDKDKRKFNIFNLIRNMRFRERMLLIYIIGGIIPFFLTLFYIDARNKAMMLEQAKKAQSEEIALICDSIGSSMNVAEDVSMHICSDGKVKQIISRVEQKDYTSRKEFEKDCLELDFIDDYLVNFEEEIASIKIFVENQTITSNKYISYIASEKEDWYRGAKDYTGRPFWTYLGSAEDKSIVLCRAILNEKGEAIGALQIFLQMNKIHEKLRQQSVRTMLLYENSNPVAANFSISPDQLLVYSRLEKAKKESSSFLLKEGIKDYLIAYEKMFPSKTKEFYTVTSIQDYQELITSHTRTNFISLLMAIVSMAVSVFLIFNFSGVFGKRIKKLKEQMHLVANGEYDAVEPVDGMDEVGQIYQELEQMMHDIKELTVRVSDEKVQKEKLHTRQKEVEFKMLASQINPHFLYNTLETIRMKAKINKQDEIEELVKMLAKIMRRNIQVEDQMVSLESEIELLMNYLVIQKYRFGDRISSEVEVEKDVDTGCLVIPLIIQPFVENAYVHGLESKEEDGRLYIHIFKEEADVIITVEDNGTGMDFVRLNKIRRGLREGEVSEEGHIGINNVNQRLKIQYGEKYGVTIDSKAGEGTIVKIRFPVVKK